MTIEKKENRNQDSGFSSDSDKAVSSWYRANSPESPPAWLDKKVLRQAKIAAKPERPSRLFLSFRQPLALAATLGLSLALILQFNDAWILGTPGADEAAGIASEYAVGSAAAANPSASPAIGGTAAILPANTRYCDAALAESPDTWWSCILLLDRDGRTVEAAAERELIMRAFPGFTPPQ